MAASYSNVPEPGLLSQQYPPALLPKPGKENVRLQKLLKKTEKKIKKKASPEMAKTPVPFRSNLSPVNEASPDLEHSDHSTPPKTPEAPFNTQHPRFAVRPAYRHVPSPYPQQQGATFGGTTRFSPKPYAAQAPTFPQHVAPLYTFTPTAPSPIPGPVSHAVAPTTPVPTSSVPEVTMTAAAQIAPPVPAPVALVTITSAATQPTLRLAPVVIHRKSPSPRFKATEATLKAPKPMFDVRQIRVYTASKSPLHDYTGKTFTADTLPRSRTPTSDIRRVITPTAEIRRSATPASEVKSNLTSTSEIKRVAMSKMNSGTTPTSEIKRSLTPTPEVKRSATPTSGVKRGLTSRPEIQRSATPTSEVKRAKTPTHDFLTPRTNLGRPKTPSYHVSRAKTPVIEISRPNPLLFAVSPITIDAHRSKTPTPGSNSANPYLSGSQNLPTSEPSKSPSTSQGARTPNGEVTSKETPTAKSPPENTSKPEAPRQKVPIVESTRPKTPTASLGYQRPKTPTNVTPTPTAPSYQRPKTLTKETLKPTAPSYGYQRPNTPTIITPKPTAPSYQRPKTPTKKTLEPTEHSYGYQRPKTPTKETSKSTAPSDGYQRPKTPTNETPKPTAPSYQRPKTPTKITLEPTEPSYGYQRTKTPTKETSKSTAPSDGYQRPKTPTNETPKPTAPSYGYQMPKTPSNEEPKPMTPTIGYQRSTTPVVGYQRPQPPAGYQRPKTPTAGVSSIGFQRPNTPTYVAPKPTHTYYGLTPAAYVAHGGIQRFSPSFGISRSKTPTLEESKTTTQELEASKIPTQELLVKTHPLPMVSNQEASSKEKITLNEAIISTTPAVKLLLPIIVVTQAEDVSEPSVSTAVTSKMATPVPETPKVKTVANTRPWAKSPTLEFKKPEVKTPTYGVIPKPKTPTTETQHPVPSAGNKDASKTIPPVSKTESPVAKARVQQKELKESPEPKTPTKATSESKPGGTKPTTSSSLGKTSAPEKPSVAVQSPAKPKDNQEAQPEKAVSAPTAASTEKEEGKDSFPAAAPLLKVIQKPKGMMKSKLSGWSRLKKHMVVEEEPPTFPESNPMKDTAKGTEQEGGEAKKDETVSFKDMVAAVTADDPPKAAKKWDSLLFDMFSSKEKIMQVIEASKSEEEKKEQPKDGPKEIPSFAHRLPVLLFSPKFDAKRLREAASRPLTKISTVFEMGLIGRKNKDEEPKDFNRTARGFTCP
ncbi:mucin-2-like [Salvelinus namaycush]|uniref:Mucin-2-like n=1 Tax=Salvelinus namaycush TaxID=8040 RepID=A0A8U1FAY8_SALNM|nr:mucin-2-like [Salvelinus namaycush]